MSKTVRFTFILAMAVVCLGPVGLTGCKSKKKLAEEAARKEAAALEARKVEYLAQIDKLMLNQVSGYADWEKRFEAMAKFQAQQEFSKDEEVKESLIKLNDFLFSERGRLREERKMKEIIQTQQEEDVSKIATERMDQYFRNISQASNHTMANELISSALELFQSSETPVLILVDQYEGKSVYDKPTTAQRYLEYLKDQRKSLYRVNEVELDDKGLIKSLELIKDY